MQQRPNGRVVFVVETSEVDYFATRRNFTLEMMHLGTFSVANEAVYSDGDMSAILPTKYLSANWSREVKTYFIWTSQYAKCHKFY